MIKGFAPARLTLSDEHDTLTIRQVPATGADPVLCTSWDLGAPEVREAVAPRSGFDGTIDATTYHSARTVSLELVVVGNAAAPAYTFAERLASFAHPSRRPRLWISRGGVGSPDEWSMVLRGTPFSVTYTRRTAAVLEMTLNFVAPEGCLEGPDRVLTSGQVAPAVGGFKFITKFEVSFGTSEGTRGATWNIGGSLPVAPVLYIYGPNARPAVYLDNGQSFALNTDLDDGQFVAVDMQAGAVLLDNSPAASVYHLVDWSRSTFWRLRPGQYVATMSAQGGEFILVWRERRLTI